MKILVIAPHPDDEILGCGGSIARFAAEGHTVVVAIMTKAVPPVFEGNQSIQSRKDALKAHDLLGVSESIFYDLPAAAIDTLPHYQVNQAMVDLMQKTMPDIVFIPFWGDIHLDHQHISLSALVAMRPNQEHYPSKIYAYETVSETNWNAPFATSGFQPNLFIDITAFLDIKLDAFALHNSQVKAFPHERSLKALAALATLRGSTVHRHAAEAFVVIRDVI